MKNTKVNQIAVIGALAIFLLSSNQALAYVPGVWDYQPRMNTVGELFTEGTATPVAPTPQTQQNSNSQANTQTQTSTQNTTPKKTSTVAKNTTSTTAEKAEKVETVEGNDLAALSLQGSGGFMPSSVWQWILVVFLILIIIILARKFSKKHTSHEDPHTAHAH